MAYTQLYFDNFDSDTVGSLPPNWTTAGAGYSASGTPTTIQPPTVTVVNNGQYETSPNSILVTPNQVWQYQGYCYAYPFLDKYAGLISVTAAAAETKNPGDFGGPSPNDVFGLIIVGPATSGGQGVYVFVLNVDVTFGSHPTYALIYGVNAPPALPWTWTTLASGTAQFPDGTYWTLSQGAAMRLEYDPAAAIVRARIWDSFTPGAEPTSWICSVSHNGLAGTNMSGGVCISPDDEAAGAPGDVNEQYYFDNFEIDTISTTSCNRLCVIDRGVFGEGRRYYSDGTNITETVYFTVKGIGVGNALEISNGTVASGSSPAAERDDRGISHLWYSRSGNIYYRQDTGSGWGAETMALSGYTCPSTDYVTGLHRTFMAAINGGHCKVLSWTTANAGDIAFTPDLADVADLGAADNICPAIEFLDTGVLQCWFVSSGSVLSAVSTDGGLTWSTPS